MIDVKTVVCNMLQENCFIVSDATNEAVVIDCGVFYDAERQAIVRYIDDHRLAVKHLLCTHAHFDHIFGNDTINEAYGVLPELHRADDFLIRNMASQVNEMMGMNYDRPVPQVEHYLAEGQIICFGEHQLKVLHTPGHSPGSVCFHCEEEGVLFAGDTLFRMSVGRTDLARGSWEQLIQSLRTVLAPLPAETIVYCGHGPQTRIGDEVRLSPYFKC